ncbi:MAG: tRNA pseudouridine(55) synthase TruB [Actinobacteria bacterium]|nr:tRNA pseudouridine(55) synthase TruB [Actinomycetota bacterium]MCA0307046.1 tRNA pseudouridine(55) synthase TruB [Actinomycetota bacterium]
MSPRNPQPATGDGLVVVDKPQGWTSHQVVGRCRRLLGTRKVGHAGTLDPMATGVLLVGVNRATRLLGHLAGHDKTYTATILLGASTVTDDAEGELVEWRGAAGITEADVRGAVPAFTGVISQVPSAVSAIKVDGKRAYARVRAGEQVELKAREVTVSRFEVTAVRPSASFGWLGGAATDAPTLEVDVEVDCSSGTYIRALARDLGAALGTGGHLTALRRTRVGGFGLDLVALDEAGLAGDDAPPLLGLADVARRAFPVVEVDARQAREIGYGRSLDLTVPADPTALVAGADLLALYRPGEDGRAHPVAVLAPASC